MAEPRADQPGRAAFVISQLYYYVAAVIGFALVLGGLIGLLLEVRQLILPREFEEARRSIRGIFLALGFVVPGAVVLWWHLGEARKRESARSVSAFWGKVLYYHLVALIALGFAVGGSVRMLTGVVDAAYPECFRTFAEIPVPEPVEPGTELEPLSPEGVRRCESRAEGGRRVLDGAVFLLVAGPLYLWHFREGRRATRLELGPETEPG